LSQRAEVALSDDFGTPAVRARLDALLLFASALRPLVPDLSKATDAEGAPDWFEIVGTLSDRLSAQLPKLTQLAQVGLIWKQFESDLTIAAVGPRTSAVLKKLDHELAIRLVKADPDLALAYLAEANERAALSIARIEIQRLKRMQAETVPLKVVVEFDPDNRQHHAQSVRGRAEVRWAFQIADYCLWAALVVDRVFEHEYFCHLLPINTHLFLDVREGFLHGGLQREHSLRAAGGTDAKVEEGRWNYALQRFWDTLLSRFKSVADENQWALRHLGERVAQVHHWEVFSYVLGQAEGPDEAAEVRSHLLEMARSGQR
jgi:hypothetical protein